MRFFENKVDILEYKEEIKSKLQDPETLIFIDTNILLWLFRVNDNSRENFLDWIDTLKSDSRVYIPNWVIHEFNRNISNNDVVFPFKGKAKSLKKQLLEISGYVKLLKNNSLSMSVNNSSIEEFDEKFEKSYEFIQKTLSILNNTNWINKNNILEQIKNAFCTTIIDTDLEEIIYRSGSQFNKRFENNIPPGFMDGDKKKNKYGDLIIWNEIIDSCKSNNISKAIVVSNDSKKDWVYKPEKIIDKDGRIRNNDGNCSCEIFLPSPYLIHEFKTKISSDDINIIDITLLTEILFSIDSEKYLDLAKAVQNDQYLQSLVISHELESEPVEEGSVEEGPVEEGPVEEGPVEEGPVEEGPVEEGPVEEGPVEEGPVEEGPVEEGPVEEGPVEEGPVEEGPSDSVSYLLSKLGESAISDSSYSFTNLRSENYLTDIELIISKLQTYNWYTQNSIVGMIKPTLLNIDIDSIELFLNSIFVLGRNILQAANGGAFELSDYLNNFVKRTRNISNLIRSVLLAGVCFEVFFDSSGRLRRVPKSTHLFKIYNLLSLDEFSQVATYINKRLEMSDLGKLLFDLGSIEIINVDIEYNYQPESEICEIIQITGDGNPLIIDAEDSYSEITNCELDLNDIKNLFRIKQGIPEEMLSFESIEGNNIYNIPGEYAFKCLHDNS